MTNVTVYDVIDKFFADDDAINIRTFDDKGSDKSLTRTFTTSKAGFHKIEGTLHEINKKGAGIFFAVNCGGNTDNEINKINAQFVENDKLSIEEQLANINSFPLQPSIIIKTRKSLHTYWFVKDAQVSRFREIQKRLCFYFDGDTNCVNESRVMRLPGFYHNKQEPVLVECIFYNPQNIYTQDELAEKLPILNETSVERKSGTERGLSIVSHGCSFIKYCNENAATLSEPLWHAMITNLAVFDGGAELIHNLSKAYPSYNTNETQYKINRFLDSGTKPMTCAEISKRGFECPRHTSNECQCKAPAALCYRPLDVAAIREIVSELSTSNDVLSNLQTASRFVETYLYNCDHVTAESAIRYIIKPHFNFSTADADSLIRTYKSLAKAETLKSKKYSPETFSLPEWYTLNKNGVKFLPGILAEHMKRNTHIFCINGEPHMYTDGVYRPVEDMVVQHLTQAQMLPRFTRHADIVDATKQWMLLVQKDRKDFNRNEYIINLRNGLFYVLDNRFSPHDPKYLSTVQLNVCYKEDASCPRFMQYLDEVLPSSQHPLLQEILGYLLVPVNTAQRCFVFVGPGATGKTVITQVINKILLGIDNVSNVSWQALDERFKPAELYGKLANIFSDLPSRAIEDNGQFKALTGNDQLTVEKKHRDPFTFTSTARLVFSCNGIPKNYGDRSDGFYRRLTIIKFDHVIPKEKRDGKLLDKLADEGDGIFLYALEGLRRLISNGFAFSETDENRAELQKYKEESNSVLLFVRECCEVSEKSNCSRVCIYERYKKFCSDSGLQPYSQTNFNKEIENNYPSVTRAKDSLSRRSMFQGITVYD